MTQLSVPDMTCGHCKASVEAALAPLSATVAVDLTTRRVTVDATSDPAALVQALEAIGFPAAVVRQSETD